MYKYDISSCFNSLVVQTGLDKELFDKSYENSLKIISDLKKRKELGNLGLLDVAEEASDLDEINEVAKHISESFDKLVVLGTGGSTLNPQIFVSISKNPDKIIFIDHTDSLAIRNTLESLDLKKTAFLSISKSGETLETIVQTLICIDFLKKGNIKNYSKHLFFITEPRKSYIKNLANELNSRVLDHDTRIGGRFSGLTNVGLLVASYLNLDIKAVRDGAKYVLDNDFGINGCNAAKGATLSVLFSERDITSTVFMPYNQGLNNFSTWYQQVWAESLGKKGKGTTPIVSFGSLDQHSQLQLYLDGPKDKMFTLLIQKECENDFPLIQGEISNNNLDFLDGRTLKDVNNSFFEGTAKSLVKNGRPVRKIFIDEINESLIGAMIMNFTLETLIAAEIQGINAFGQPAVEHGKHISRKILQSL